MCVTGGGVRKPDRKPNKYRARVCTVEGIRFASRAEARRYRELKLLERAGAISALERQPVFFITIEGRAVKMRNGRCARYTADFAYQENGQRVVEDVKGYRVRDYPLRRALIEHIYKIKIREID